MEKLKLKPEVKQLWLETLRNGNLQQGSYYLKYRNTDQAVRCGQNAICYCVQGVLTQLGINTDATKLEETTASKVVGDVGAILFMDVTHGLGWDTVMPRPTVLWAFGIDYDTYQHDSSRMEYSESINGRLHYMAAANDRGASFEELANYIETEF